MLTFFGRRRRFCDGISRRDFLRVGALSVGGLSMADLMRRRAAANTSPVSGKSVIMVFLHGGPSHLDMYDMKPRAPVEFRGEFQPIAGNVPGMDCCELMPLQAQIMDKLVILRGLHFVEEHSAHSLWTGFPERVNRPAFGSVVSYLKGRQDGLPPYVSLMNQPLSENPAYCGTAHRPFVPSGPGLEDLSLTAGISVDRLRDRKQLLGSLDTIRREVDYRGALEGLDGYTVRALDMVASNKSREAFDLEREPQAVRDKYGKANEDFLRARRLVEAGISVVTLVVGGWDTHGNNFNALRKMLPRLDQGVHALVTDLEERGLARDVAVIVWGEFGRTPRVNPSAGRDHWPRAGFALMAGGKFQKGQIIGETDRRGEVPVGPSMTSSHVLTSLYHHLGIDPALTIPDHNGRPTYLLDEREPVPGLV
ncbi:MAG TPA: DUF1501 domain-containing protein [Pirellulales bacterium]|nr:DUF1501 domain-containing protein [Pirellulales bacterium]